VNKKPQKPFLWIPGEGCDEAALARMRKEFPRPCEPMGEAWFMGKTRAMFWDLMGDLDALPIGELSTPLFEIASGALAFGERDEWTFWFHHLLARTLPRAHDEYAFYSLIEPLTTAFFALHPQGVREPYKGFRADALATLGRSMMNPSCWNGDRIRLGSFLHRECNPRVGVWFWYDASGDFSASMFFCLKYLDAESIAPWLRSVLDIPCPHWRAQIMVWFVGAHDLLAGRILDPADYDRRDRPSLSWVSSHLLRCDPALGLDAAFLPRANRDATLATLASFMNDDVYLDWLCSIADVDYLESELADLPERFRELYVMKP
jgi:hypothetical protein